MNAPTPAEPLLDDCTACGGSGCDVCGGTGRMVVADRCPLLVVTADSWEMLELADIYRRGLPPVAGGSLDQAAGFVAAARFVWGQDDRWRAELKMLPFAVMG